MKHYDFLLIDLIMVQVAYLLAQLLRNQKLFPPSRPIYVTINFVMLITVFLTAVLLEVHKNILKRSHLAELWNVLRQMTVLMVTILVWLFFFDHAGVFSRLVIVYLAAIGSVLLFLTHILWKRCLAMIPRPESTMRHMLLVTDTKQAPRAVRTILLSKSVDIAVNGVVLVDAPGHVGEEIGGLPVVAEMEDLLSYILDNWVDEVMIYLDEEPELLKQVQDQCLEMGITTHIRIRTGSDRGSVKTVEKVAGCVVLTESIRIISARDQVLKRLMDIAGALVGLFITGFLAVIFKILIQIHDPGPLFFSQERIGQNGRVFRIYKFRTMVMDAERKKGELAGHNEMQGHMFKLTNDPRVIGSGPDGTKKGYGYFLRTTSLDEFPQFWNVLKGEMSLVGTRPPLVEEWKNYEAHHRVRMACKPGLTGLWQTSGRNKVTDFEEVIAYDRKYINNWSLGRDLLIILKTFGAIIRREGY